jgi:predicted dehydrogenase
MELLLIGMSRFARRRVLPAVASMDTIGTVHVASAHADAATAAVPRAGRFFRDWRAALDTVEPCLVYVSVVNDQHAPLVEYALGRGHHVVVDKPGLPDLATAEEAVALARSSSLVLAEATCYAHHPLYPALSRLQRDLGSPATSAVAVFTPPVPKTDFRHDRASGGGALPDTGPYMASLGRVLWGAEPTRLEVVVDGRAPDSLELSYSVLASYPEGRSAVGHFGFTTVYQNDLRLLGGTYALEVERPFSVLPDAGTDIRVRTHTEQYVHPVETGDSMRIFLSEVVEAVRSNSRRFDEMLLSDARTLDRLVRAASDPLLRS